MVIEELTHLVRLQNIDAKLLDLEAEKGDLPEQLASLSHEIARFDSVIQQAERTLAETSSLKGQQEQAIETAKERQKKSQSTIFSVKTTREYDAISSEIEQAKRQIAEAERQLIELLAREEDAEQLLTQTHSKLAVIKEEYREKQMDMQERMEVSQDEELKLQHEREKIVVALKDPVYAHYERIRKIRDGVGVSALENGACSYCFAMIPPQRQTEIRRMNDLILCEVCGCILVAINN